MKVDKQELYALLNGLNPWWRHQRSPDLPQWRRAAFAEVRKWIIDPPDARAIILSGARQVGKTTLLLQLVDHLIESGVKPASILYATFDHPFLKPLGPEELLRIWREIQPETGELEYLFLDEIQNTQHWDVWLKHQVDFKRKQRRIAVTGSALPLHKAGTESGVGRWHTIKISTLSFYEYFQIKELGLPKVTGPKSLQKLFRLKEGELFRLREDCRSLVPHFHEYILRGGFPQAALADSVSMAQKLLREDIVDRVMKKDITDLFGIRSISDLETILYYLCMNDGGILSLTKLSKNLEISVPTIHRYINILEAANFIYKLRIFGYGKKLLRSGLKVYLADSAIAGSVLIRGRSLLEDEMRLGTAIESAFFKQVYMRFYEESIGFYYWRGTTDREVDIIAQLGDLIIPFEVKYKGAGVRAKDLKGLKEFCSQHKIDRAYVITRNVEDFGPISLGDTKTMRIPAPLACYWLSESESEW